MNSIKFPNTLTYFIASTGADATWGTVSPEQEMITPHTTLWTTLDESEWISKLESEYGVNPQTRLSGVVLSSNNDLF